jgi:hypothetical protein
VRTKSPIRSLLVLTALSAFGEDSSLSPLRLEWPAWLQVPGGVLISQRAKPRGRIVTGSADSCPGDVLGKPSQGCLTRVYESHVPLASLYSYFGSLLQQNGYTTQNPTERPYSNPQSGSWIADPLAELKMRQYPAPGDDSYYRHVEIFLRQPRTPRTKVEITFLTKNGRMVEAPVPNIAPLADRADRKLRQMWQDLPSPTPRSRDEWQWVIQSVATGTGAEIKYTNYYYEQATGRSVNQLLPLPDGGVIVHVFPDAGFYLEDDNGNSVKFGNSKDAIGKTVAPGNWTVYPIKVSGVDVYFADRATLVRRRASSSAATGAATTPPPSDMKASTPPISTGQPIDPSQVSEGLDRSELISRYGEPMMRITDRNGSELVERLWYKTATSTQMEIRIINGKVASVGPPDSGTR